MKASDPPETSDPAAALAPMFEPTMGRGPLLTTRTLDDAMALLAEVERDAIGAFSRHGLPLRPGLYCRQERDGEWVLLEGPASAGDRWDMILSRPPEAGFHYLSLADVGRVERPEEAEVHAAAATLDRISDLRRLLLSDGEEDTAALLMFWSTVELMAALFAPDDRSGR